MATDPQTLIAQASCYNCDAPEYQLIKLGLLRQILLALNPSAVTDPQTLINQASCYNCYFPQWPLLELALLQQIVANGGSGPGQVCIIGGVGPPAVAVPCNFSVYVEQPGPNYGLWLGDLVTGWSAVIAQGP